MKSVRSGFSFKHRKPLSKILREKAQGFGIDIFKFLCYHISTGERRIYCYPKILNIKYTIKSKEAQEWQHRLLAKRLY